MGVALLLGLFLVDIVVWDGFLFGEGTVGLPVLSVYIDMLSVGFSGKCYMNTLPFACIGMWGISSAFFLHRVLGVREFWAEGLTLLRGTLVSLCGDDFLFPFFLSFLS